MTEREQYEYLKTSYIYEIRALLCRDSKINVEALTDEAIELLAYNALKNELIMFGGIYNGNMGDKRIKQA